jgi:hypothetical protein
MPEGIWNLQVLELFSHEDITVQMLAIIETHATTPTMNIPKNIKNLIIATDDTTSSVVPKPGE